MLYLDESRRRMCHEETNECCEMFTPLQWGAIKVIAGNGESITTFDDVIAAAYADIYECAGVTNDAITCLIQRVKQKVNTISGKTHIISAHSYGWRFSKEGLESLEDA